MFLMYWFPSGQTSCVVIWIFHEFFPLDSWVQTHSIRFVLINIYISNRSQTQHQEHERSRIPIFIAQNMINCDAWKLCFLWKLSVSFRLIAKRFNFEHSYGQMAINKYINCKHVSPLTPLQTHWAVCCLLSENRISSMNERLLPCSSWRCWQSIRLDGSIIQQCDVNKLDREAGGANRSFKSLDYYSIHQFRPLCFASAHFPQTKNWPTTG